MCTFLLVNIKKMTTKLKTNWQDDDGESSFSDTSLLGKYIGTRCI